MLSVVYLCVLCVENLACPPICLEDVLLWFSNRMTNARCQMTISELKPFSSFLGGTGRFLDTGNFQLV